MRWGLDDARFSQRIRLQEICLDLKAVNIVTEPRGINGWWVHLCFSNDKCCDFSVDQGQLAYDDTLKETEKAIVKQLKYHEAHKNEG